MRSVRRSLPDRAERSERIWRRVEALDVVRLADVVMVFTSVPGEPDTSAFIARRRALGTTIVLPEDVPPPDPTCIDVVIVPAVALTRAGARLGQGGGWYDRFLSRVRSDCATIGVGFEPQLLEQLPTEPHDVPLDTVVTDAGVVDSVGFRAAGR